MCSRGLVWSGKKKPGDVQNEASPRERGVQVCLKPGLLPTKYSSFFGFIIKKSIALVTSQPSINNMAMSPLTSPPGHGSSDVAG